MSFLERLVSAAEPLTAAEAAAAVSSLLSRRTMEDWLQGRRTPPAWTHEIILWRVEERARKVSEEKHHE